MGRAAEAARSASVWVGAALALAIGVMANYLAHRHYLRADWTRAQVFSLSDKTRQVLRGVAQDVRVTVFMFPPGRGQESVYAETRELLERFQQHSARIKVEFVDPDRAPDKVNLLAKKYKINMDDLSQGGVVVFSAGAQDDKVKYVTADDLAEYDYDAEEAGGGRRLKAFTGEAAFLGALRTVTEGEPTQVCFTSGHDEAAIDSSEDSGASYLEDELKRDNYKTRKLDAAALPGGAVPKDCAIIAIVGPQRGFATPELDALGAYLDGGGRLLVLSGPVIDRNLTGFVKTGLERLLESWGARLGDNLVLDVLAVPGEQPLLTWATQQGYGEHPIVKGWRDKLTVFPYAREVRAVSGEAIEAAELVSSSDQGWAETNLGSLRDDLGPKLDPATDVKGPVPIAVAAEHKDKKARLVVFGSDRFVLNYRLGGVVVRDYDRDLVLSALAWLADKKELVAVGPKTPEHFKLALTGDQVVQVALLTLVGLPGAALVLGGVVWWRRRR